MGDRVLELIIQAKDLTGRTVSKFRRNWRSMRRTITDVTRAVAGFTAGMAAAVLGLQKITERGENVIAVKRAFARITGDEVAALEKLREASRGTIEDYRLMALANQSLTLGASKTVEQFAEQVRLSRALGRAQDLEATQALEKFTLALARQSAQRADDLGLQLKGIDATRFHAEFMEQARRKAHELTGGLDDTASAAARFATGFRNGRDRMAEWVATSEEVAAFFDLGHDIVTGITDAIVTQDWNLLGDIFKTLGEAMADAWILGWNKAFQKMPERGGFSEWLENTVPGLRAIREWWERSGTPLGQTQEEFFQGGVDLARQNLDTDMQTLRALLESARRGAGRPAAGGGGRGGAGVTAGGITIPGGLTAPALPGSPFPADARAAFAERQRRVRFMPAGLASMANLEPTAVAGLSSEQRALLEAINESDTVRNAAGDWEEAGQVVAASMGSAAAAVIAGSDNIAESMVRMITDITRSLPGVGGLTGALIGGVGGIFGALFSRRRDPVPVRMADVDDRAARKLKDAGSDPPNLRVIIEQGGVPIDEIEVLLAERQRRNATVRAGRRGFLRTRGSG